MTKLNRVLYAVCITSVALLAALILIAVWGEIGSDIMWKLIGSVTVAMLASGFVLAINFHLQKMKSEKREDEKK